MGEQSAPNNDGKDKRSAFYKFRLKWMPFANLSVIGLAVFGLFQLPNVEVSIVEPYAQATGTETSVSEVANPFTLRLNIEKTLGCDFQPSSIKAVAKPANGSVIVIDGFVQDIQAWKVNSVELPLGEYELEVLVEADCGGTEIVTDSMKINVVCRPISVNKARTNGDVCGEYVSDSCGGYVKLDSCIDFGADDPRVNTEKLNCSQAGYYVGKSISEYVTSDGADHFYTALKCGSGNKKDCYELSSKPGSCRYSKSPEEFAFYGSRDDSSFHKCRIDCS